MRKLKVFQVIESEKWNYTKLKDDHYITLLISVIYKLSVDKVAKIKFKIIIIIIIK